MFLVKAKEYLIYDEIRSCYLILNHCVLGDNFTTYLTKDKIYLCVEVIYSNTCYRIKNDDSEKSRVHFESHFTKVTFVDVWELKRNEEV